MKKRFAIAGCGSIAKKHVQVIENYLENAEIVAFQDIVLERARAFAEKHNAAAFSSVDEMMDAIGDSIDIINILTPSGEHHKKVLELVRYGKPLVVEKPIALRLDQADEIIQECDKYGVRLFVVHQNRYNLPIIKAREALEQGRFGKMVMGTIRLRWKRDQAYYDSAAWRGTWSCDGGVMTNQASHHIDMLTWFFGGVESVQAMISTRLVDIECEDTGAALFRFSSGALGIVEATTAVRPKDLEGSISILGEKGSVVIGGFFMNKLETWQFADHQPIDDVIFDQFGTNPDIPGYNLGEYLKGVIKALETQKAALVDGIEARKSLELISAIYESVETSREVTLRFKPKQCRLGIG
ncbi:MAG: Gfo/Idh/MocA family oxidoreductase [Candidatus Latescibacterota bacterium]